MQPLPADSPFSVDYGQARSRFLAAAGARGARLFRYEHPERGPDGDDLSTDVAWIGAEDAERVLLTVSATHGVEGFAGSACQLDWLLRDEHLRVPDGVAVCLVHAINPYGFAWRRRVTHENVDLNRNWIHFNQPLPANPGYAALAGALRPSSLEGEAGRQAAEAIRAFVAERGMAAFVQAVSSGQYVDPLGLFFGGRGPVWSREVLTDVFQTHLARVRDLAIVDFHTGLGPSGYGELMVSDGAEGPVTTRALRWFGGLVTPVGGPGSSSAPLSGDWLAAAPSLAPQARVTAIALEFGTVPPMEVLEALRADGWLHAHGDPRGEAAEAVRARTTRAFYTPTEQWRGMVLGQGLVVQRQALAGLTGEP